MSFDIYGLLILHEGMSLGAYRCPAGKLTIGVGHNLDANPVSGVTPATVITHARALEILHRDVANISRELFGRVPWAAGLDDVRRAVLVDMAFNLGVVGLLEFKHFLALLQRGAYFNASKEMLDSRWAKQVGDRAHRLSRMVAMGEWPEELR